jgi:RimJ/RimL family protein N-acetyltransferase
LTLALPETLTDGAVTLRLLREADRDDVLETMRDPLVRRWLNMPRDPSTASFDQLLRIARDGRRSGDRFDFAIVDGGDAAVGAVIASRRHRDNYELAYLAGPRGRGHGYVTRAVRLVAEELFRRGVGRIEVRTHPGNEPSQRVAERCGFQREGVERRSIWLHGQRADAILWSLLPDDPPGDCAPSTPV